MTDPVDCFRRSADRAIGLVEQISDPDASVPGSEWTTGELVAHLVSVCDNMTGMARGGGRPYRSVETIAEENRAMIDEVAGRDAATLRAAADTLAKELGTPPPDQRFRWHAGIEVSRRDGAGIAAGEMLVHGYDLAKALRQPWVIAPADASTVLDALIGIVPNFIDETNATGLRAVYDVRLRGDGRYRIEFDDGKCTVDRTDEVRGADCRISADPVAFLLVSFGRRSQWSAAATGKVTAWGRKPWLGFKFASLIRSP